MYIELQQKYVNWEIKTKKKKLALLMLTEGSYLIYSCFIFINTFFFQHYNLIIIKYKNHQAIDIHRITKKNASINSMKWVFVYYPIQFQFET